MPSLFAVVIPNLQVRNPGVGWSSGYLADS